MELLEKILDDKNLYHAYKQVYKNKGASGVDGITVEELGVYLFQHKEEIKEQIRNLKYKPSPVRRVEIPKENGKMRKLGIPTVVDRVIQQAIREMFFPEYYLNTWEIFKPLHKGGIHPHMDHCIEKYVSSLVRNFYNIFLTDATTVVSVNPSCVTPTCLCTPTGGSLNRRNPRSSSFVGKQIARISRDRGRKCRNKRSAVKGSFSVEVA